MNINVSAFFLMQKAICVDVISVIYSNFAKKIIFTSQEKYDKAADDATECKNQPLYFIIF